MALSMGICDEIFLVAFPAVPTLELDIFQRLGLVWGLGPLWLAASAFQFEVW